MGQKPGGLDDLTQFNKLRVQGYSAFQARDIIRGRKIKQQVANITSWVDCKLALQQIIKDIYPTDPEG